MARSRSHAYTNTNLARSPGAAGRPRTPPVAAVWGSPLQGQAASSNQHMEFEILLSYWAQLPPILGLFSTATPPGSALTILNLPGINSFCSSCSRWLQLPTVALEDLPRRPSVTLQPQNTGVVFFSAKVRPDDQDTQQRCEQSDKKADA